MESKDKLSYSIRELEAASGLSKSKIYNLINAGSLTALNCAGKTIVTTAEYRRFLNSLKKVDLDAKRKAKPRGKVELDDINAALAGETDAVQRAAAAMDSKP